MSPFQSYPAQWSQFSPLNQPNHDSTGGFSSGPSSGHTDPFNGMAPSDSGEFYSPPMSSDTTTQPEQESGAVTSLTRNTCWNLPAPYPGHRGSTYEQMSLANGSNPSLSASANGDSFFSAVQSRNIEGASVNPNITAVDFSNAGAASSPSSSVPDDPTPLLMGPDKRYKCDKCSKTYTAKHNLRMHRDLKHLGKSKPYLCEFCSRDFTGTRARVRHMENQNACPSSTRRVKRRKI